MRQLLTESLVLALAGGLLGVAIAAGGSRLLLRMVSSDGDPLPLDLSMNTNLLLFTLGGDAVYRGAVWDDPGIAGDAAAAD